MRFEFLVCADDLTGALDTGVQFAKRGAAVVVLPGYDPEREIASAGEGEVLVVNTASRHLPCQEAYQKVYDAVRSVRVRHYYKKTDSALRGNIGAELDAMMDALGGERLVFAPAYPALGRTTVCGRQYVNGVPLEESAFARDPLQPSHTSDIREIISEQCGKAVYTHGTALVDIRENGIHVMDGETDGQLLNLVETLKAKGLMGITAGCAGFAEAISRQIDFHGWQEGGHLPPCNGTLCLCGSMNAVSLAQCEYAATHGYDRIILPDMGMQTGFADSAEGQQLILHCGERLSAGHDMLLQSAQREADGNVAASAAQAVAENMAVLGEKILKGNPSTLLCVVGGDTLLEVMKQMKCTAILSLRPAAEGLPVSVARYEGGQTALASKSGGFGAPDVLMAVAGGGSGIA